MKINPTIAVSLKEEEFVRTIVNKQAPFVAHQEFSMFYLILQIWGNLFLENPEGVDILILI